MAAHFQQCLRVGGWDGMALKKCAESRALMFVSGEQKCVRPPFAYVLAGCEHALCVCDQCYDSSPPSMH